MAPLFVQLFYGYLIIGVLFAIWFVTAGVNRLDHGMQGASTGLRLLIVPGAILLWPVLLTKCLRSK